MAPSRFPSLAELALLGLASDAALPSGGHHVRGELLGGDDTTHSAEAWTDTFNPVFGSQVGVRFERGSFNLRVQPVEWQAPWSLLIRTQVWEFCPLIIEECAVGLAFRGNRARPDLLEVALPVHLRTVLGGLANGAWLTSRLLPGRPLWSAA